MKHTLLFIAIACALVSCDKNRKIAYEYMERSLNCPGTMKVVFENKFYEPESKYIDTCYRINYIHNKYRFDYEYECYYLGDNADYFTLDSVCYVYNNFPGCVGYNFIIDAQNLMGATVRDTFYIFVLDEQAFEANNLYSYVYSKYRNKEYGECVDYKITEDDLPQFIGQIKVGDYIYLSGDKVINLHNNR